MIFNLRRCSLCNNMATSDKLRENKSNEEIEMQRSHVAKLDNLFIYVWYLSEYFSIIHTYKHLYTYILL